METCEFGFHGDDIDMILMAGPTLLATVSDLNTVEPTWLEIKSTSLQVRASYCRKNAIRDPTPSAQRLPAVGGAELGKRALPASLIWLFSALLSQQISLVERTTAASAWQSIITLDWACSSALWQSDAMRMCVQRRVAEALREKEDIRIRKTAIFIWR